MAEASDVCRENDNTLRDVCVPIVFVPGIMGSRLHFPAPNEKWDPDSSWAMMHWVRICAETERDELNYTAAAQVMTGEYHKLDATEEKRGWEGVSWEFYGEFLRWLRTNNPTKTRCPVYAVGYDWRQDNKASGKYLVGKINDILTFEKAEQLIIISHSMGGLVTRSALKQSPDLAAKVIGVMHVVQPAAGAVVFYRRFFTGAIKEFDGGWGFSKIMGTTAEDFATVVSILPGAMQLMPTNDYKYENAAWLFYERTAGTATPEKRNPFDFYGVSDVPPGFIDPIFPPRVRADLGYRIKDLKAFHDWLAGYKHNKTWAIYGSGLSTDHRVIFQQFKDAKKDQHGIQWERPDEGDETVPGPSGAALFPGQAYREDEPLSDEFRQFVVANLNHGDAFKSAAVRDRVKQFIWHVLK